MDQLTTQDPVARARALGPALEAASNEIETTQRWPQELLEQLHAAKLMRLFLPKSCGGEQTDPAPTSARCRRWRAMRALSVGTCLWPTAPRC